MIRCPNCGGLFTKNDDGDLECEHCGFISTNNRAVKKHIERINRTINDAAVIRAQTAWKKEKLKLWKIVVCVFTAILLIVFGIISITQYKKAHPEFKITMKINSRDLVNRSYQEVESSLSDHGFTNISCIPLEDLTNPNDRNIGKVRNVSIGGKESFSAEGFMRYADVFMSTDQIRIYYHSLRDE